MASQRPSSSLSRAAASRSFRPSASQPAGSGTPSGSGLAGPSRPLSNAPIVTSSMVPKSRYTLASTYDNTNVTPLHREVSNVPLSTMTATCIAALMYLVPVIMLLVIKCPFTREVMSFFSFLLVALLALATMAGINMIFPRYRFNCLSLSVSLLYSGSAALILYGLVDTACYGLCWPSDYIAPPIEATTKMPGNETNATTPAANTRSYLFSDYDDDKFQILSNTRAASFEQASSVGLFRSGSISNYFMWAFTAIGFCFQVVAHYYYG